MQIRDDGPVNKPVVIPKKQVPPLKTTNPKTTENTTATINTKKDMEEQRELRRLATLNASVGAVNPKVMFDVTQNLQTQNTLSYQRLLNQKEKAEKEEKALKTLTTNGNFEKVDADHNGKISLDEAGAYASRSQKPHDDSIRTDEVEKAAAYLAWDSNWLSQEKEMNPEVSLKQLQDGHQTAEKKANAFKILSDKKNFDKVDTDH